MVLFTSSWFHWNNDRTHTTNSTSNDNNENDFVSTRPILLKKDHDLNTSTTTTTRILPSSSSSCKNSAEYNDDDNRDENIQNISGGVNINNKHSYGSCEQEQQQQQLKPKMTQSLLPSNEKQHSVLVWDRPLSILNTKHRTKSDNNVQYQKIAFQTQQQQQQPFKRSRYHNRCNSDESLLLHQRLTPSSSSSLSSKSKSYSFYNPHNISSTSTDSSIDKNHDSCTTINTNDTTGSINFKIDSIDYNLLYMCLLYTGIYFIIAIIAYSYIFESWTVIDSLYFAVATYTTVGYGDLQPTTQYGQFFTIIFALYGVVIIGIFLGIVGHAISNDTLHKEQQIKQQNENIILQSFRQYSSIQSKSTIDHATATTTTTGTGSLNHSSFSSVEQRIPAESTHHAKVDVCSSENKKQSSISTSSFINNHFILLRIIQQVIVVQYKSILGIMILAIILGIRENWSITSTLYFAIMSASTTGFGDYTPKTQIDKLYCIFFLPLSVAIFGDILGRIANTYIRQCHYHRTNTILQQQLFSNNNTTTTTTCNKQINSTDNDNDNSNNLSNIIRTMDTNQDGKVDEQDFLLFMLIALDKCDTELIQEIKDIFHSLDRDGNGTLEKDDFVDIVVQTSSLTGATNGSCTSKRRHDLDVIDEEDQTIQS